MIEAAKEMNPGNFFFNAHDRKGTRTTYVAVRKACFPGVV